MLDCAIKANAVEMVQYLLSQKANVNALNSKGTPPLTIAILRLKGLYTRQTANASKENSAEKMEKILDLLLEEPSIDLNIQNSQGWTAGVLATPCDKIVKRLISKGASLNYCNKNGNSPLQYYIAKQDHESINSLLEIKVNPNLGSPSPLSQAIYNNDPILLKKLIDVGAKAFEADGKGNVPIIEAVFKASPEIVEILLKLKDKDLQVVDQAGINPLIAALISGNQKKLQTLHEQNAPLPIVLHYPPTYLNTAFSLLSARKGCNSIIELLEGHPDSNSQVLLYLFNTVIQNSHSFIDEHEILLTYFLSNARALFLKNTDGMMTLLNFIKSPDIDTKLKKKLVEGFNFAEKLPFGKDDLFNYIIKSNNLELVEYAIENGANVHGTAPKTHPLPLQAVDLNSSAGKEIFKLLVSRGANLSQ